MRKRKFGNLLKRKTSMSYLFNNQMLEHNVVLNLEDKIKNLTDEHKKLEESKIKLEKEYKAKLNQLANEKEDLRQKSLEVESKYDKKIKDIEADFSQKEEKLRKELDNRKSKLERSYIEKENELISQLNNKEIKLEEEHKAILSDLDEKKQKLESEFQMKYDILESEFKEKNEKLDSEYDTKNKELEEYYEELDKEQNEQNNNKLQEIKDFEEKALKEIERLESELNDKKHSFELFKEKELKELENFKKQELDILDANIKEEMEKVAKNKELEVAEINKQKEQFIEWKTNELKKLEEKEIEFEEHKKQELIKIDKYQEESLRAIKIESETLALKKDEFERDVEKQSLSERKFALKKEKIDYYLSDRFLYGKIVNTIKKHKIISTILIVLIIIGSVYGVVTSEYKLNPKKFVSSTINSEKNFNALRNKTIIYFDTSESVNDDFKILGDSSLTLINERNSSLNEYYSKYIFAYNNRDFEWERFHKNETKIIKTPYEPQYIIVDDYKSKGFTFETSNENKLLNDSLTQFINYNTYQNFDIKEKQRTEPVELNFTGYLKSLLPANDFRYYYKIKSDSEASQKLLSDLLIKLLSDSNYMSFLKEEQAIQEKLKFTDNVLEVKGILENLIKKSKVKSSEVYFVIDKSGLINNVDINFEIDYVLPNLELVNFGLHINHSIERLDVDYELERSIFRINSTPYELVFPRVEREPYKETISSPVQESITTVKDLEKIEGVDFGDEIVETESEEQKD